MKKISSYLTIQILVGISLLSCLLAAQPIAEWQLVPTETGCTARHETSAAAVDGIFYLIGGRGVMNVEAFDPATSRWTKKGMVPMELHHFAAIPVTNKIAVFGALTGGYPKEQSVPNLWWYEPAKDEWTQGAEIPEDRRRGASGCVLDGDLLYLLCGNTNGHWNGCVPWLDTLNLKTGEWTRLPDAPHARDHFQAGLVDGKIICSGGRRTEAEHGHVFDLTVSEVDVYDIAKETWSTLEKPIPTPRAGAPTITHNGKIIVIGGESGQDLAHSEVEAFSLATGDWETLPPMVEGRHSGGVALIGDDIYFAAGCLKHGGGTDQSTILKFSIPKQP